MVGTALGAFGIAGLLGALVMFVFHKLDVRNYYTNEPRRIAIGEFVFVLAALAGIFIPSVLGVGNMLSVQELLRYQQFVNGKETDTHDHVELCYAGQSGDDDRAGKSNCQHTYVSGTYDWTWIESITTCTSDSKGNQTCTVSYVTHYETSNIYTPYATREHTYSIDSSMGAGGTMSYTFPYAYLDEKPVRFPASTREIPGDILRGAPADWKEAVARLAAHNARPVTKIAEYDNYILASHDDILNAYSTKIDAYLSASLLPDHTASINTDPISGPSRSQASKVSFVGVSVANPDVWQQTVMNFNAALGMKLQGDLHVVVVDSAKIPVGEAEDYVTALKAYWQGPVFGRRALAKNSVILVIGTNGSTIDWARAQTGMPFGNEAMEQWIQDSLPGKALDPSTIFGWPVTTIKAGIAPDKFTGGDFSVALSSPRGIVEEVMFETAPFKRARMSCNDNTCVGYKDLVNKIEPTAWQKTWMVVVTSVIALILWIIVAMTSFISRFIGFLGRFFKQFKSSPSDVAESSDKEELDETPRRHNSDTPRLHDHYNHFNERNPW